MSSSTYPPHSSNSSLPRRVKILDPILANQIAAGEVVERPASAIKELLENALDAGSSALTIEIRDGGRTLMRVTDNGHGMTKDDALLALERHATSKISAVDDLNEISTLGFRGEALPSIASVSRFQLLTKTAEQQSATLIQVEGGQNPQITQGAGRVGTEVRVEDLFFNVPARRKFLKSAQTESGIIHEGVQRLALAYPQVAFKFIKDGHVSLELPSHRSPLERIRALFGSRVADHLCPVAWTGPVRLDGFVSHPSFHFSSHRHAYTFINGRFIKDRLFLGAIQRAFGQKLPKGRFPFYLLNLDIHPSLIDVNVHPAKTQVRFVNEEALLDVLTKAFKAAMSDMVFEDEGQSWRERVVDQKALQISESTSHFSDKHQSAGKATKEVLKTNLPKPSPQQLRQQEEMNQTLEAHRARIQERLRKHLHGEDIDLSPESFRGGDTQNASRSSSKAQSQRVESPQDTQTSDSGSTRKKANRKNSKDTFKLDQSSNRHEVTRVTQDDLEAWKQSGSQENESTSIPIEQEVEHQLASENTTKSINFAQIAFPTSAEESVNSFSRLPSLQVLNQTTARQSLRVVGRADEWWIQEAADGLVFIHLPTARIHAVTDQPRKVPYIGSVQVSLNPQEEKELEKHNEGLEKLGLAIENFGGQIYRLASVPQGLEHESASHLVSVIHDLLGSKQDDLLLAWSKVLQLLPLSSEGRSFTLQWLEQGGAADIRLPPYMVCYPYQELLKRCLHLTPF